MIHDTAKKIPIANVTPFGLSDAVILSLSTSIAQYKEDAPATRTVITNKTALTEQVATLVDEGNTIVRKQLLKVSRQLKTTEPVFYTGLVASAKLMRNNTHAKVRITALEEDLNYVENAQVTISGTNMTGMTDAKGGCTLTKVPKGMREVSVTKANYITWNANINFQNGHSITRKVIMNKTNFDVPAVVQAKVKA